MNEIKIEKEVRLKLEDKSIVLEEGDLIRILEISGTIDYERAIKPIIVDTIKEGLQVISKRYGTQWIDVDEGFSTFSSADENIISGVGKTTLYYMDSTQNFPKFFSKKITKLIDGLITKAQEVYIEENRELSLRIGAEHMNYDDLNSMGYDAEATNLAVLINEYLVDFALSISYNIIAYHAPPTKSKMEHSIYVVGGMNFDDWKRISEVESVHTAEFVFSDEKELQTKLDKEIKIILRSLGT